MAPFCNAGTRTHAPSSLTHAKPSPHPPHPPKKTTRYNGRPHWGKNFDRTFTHPKCPVRAKYPKFNDMVSMQERYDPTRSFESALFAKVKAGTPAARTV